MKKHNFKEFIKNNLFEIIGVSLVFVIQLVYCIGIIFYLDKTHEIIGTQSTIDPTSNYEYFHSAIMMNHEAFAKFLNALPTIFPYVGIVVLFILIIKKKYNWIGVLSTSILLPPFIGIMIHPDYFANISELLNLFLLKGWIILGTIVLGIVTSILISYLKKKKA